MKIAILGLGLIGGSLGKSLKVFNNKVHNNKYRILGIGRKKDALNTAIKTGAVDEASLFLTDCFDADIIVIAMPVDLTVETYKKLISIVKKGAIITDVGSVKYSIEKEIEDINKKGNFASFVGAHPMSGKETNGLANSTADLFNKANVVITGSVKKSLKNENIVAQMWQDAGANIIKMSAKKHDELVALTSHLPHLMAFALHKIYKDKKSKDKDIEKILAGSFYSAIRVASSSADMWAPIFANNSANIKNNLNNFIKELNSLGKTLNNKIKVKKQILKTQ
ncbi:MAG: prephenate dehydrogenase/arogenate dehydrogenase family protein [Elusimicrobiota bacterium]|nr:prephenate dehydrogenase/arogenate dehydrogenase family protein [Elusimicrobiota bacterium]